MGPDHGARTDGPGPPVPEDVPFAEFETARRYVALMTDLTDRERADRLAVLEEFSRFVGRTPDQMIEEIFNVETRKYRKRGFYSERILEFSAQVEGPWAVQAARGNVIRSFFIANGRRVPNARPPWL